MSFSERVCCICGVLCEGYLCPRHRRSFRFIEKYGIFALKPRRRISKCQTILHRYIRGFFHKSTYQEVTFDFNIFSRYDIVVPDLQFICEFDGRQHFIFTKMFHKTRELFEVSKVKEKEKQEIAERMGYKVIRFSYVENVKDKGYVKKKLELKL